MKLPNGHNARVEHGFGVILPAKEAIFVGHEIGLEH
jgi:hypothetical protein